MTATASATVEEDFVLSNQLCRTRGMELINHRRSRICQDKLGNNTRNIRFHNISGGSTVNVQELIT
ncbi:hypothetical protein NC651_005751 [Populus alba x Populus x berolinensis]|nr:hypothetical protein NC651_005751 [Populus alba x Populus x berolinensis]